MIKTVNLQKIFKTEEVQTWALNNVNIEVKEGVTKGDRIVNNPSAALLEGDKARIVTPAPGYEVLAQGVEVPIPAESKK